MAVHIGMLFSQLAVANSCVCAFLIFLFPSRIEIKCKNLDYCKHVCAVILEPKYERRQNLLL